MAQKPLQMLQKLAGQTLERQINLRAESLTIDEEKRTIELAFSSEEPVSRWGIDEVLQHTADSIESTRLDNGTAPLLLNHDRNQLIGVVDAWRLDEDRIGRATVRFSPHSELARQVFDEVKDGFRKGVSFGYRILNGDMAKRVVDGNEDDYFLATKWMPVEVSIEAIPADATVGVGRSLEDNETPINEAVEEQRAEVPGEATPAIENPAVETPAEVRKNTEVKTTMVEKTDAEKFMDFARAIGEEALGKEFVVNGRSEDEFKKAVGDKMAAAGARTEPIGTPVDGIPASQIGMSRKETESYSLLRAIGAALTNDWTKAGLEREASTEVAKRAGHEPKNGGFFVPAEVQNMKRDLSVAGGLATGGALVATDLKAESFIDLLRAKSVVYGLGAQRLTGLRGDIAIPKQTGASTAYWVKEGVPPTESQPAFGQIAMTPKTLGDMVEFTRKLLMQSNPSVEALVYRDIAKVMALGIDKAALNGLAANDEPVGILNQTGTGVMSGTGAGGIMQFSDFTDAEGLLEEANVEAGTLAFLSRPAYRATLKSRTKVTGQPIYITTDGNLTNGYNHAVSTQVPSGKLIFGDFSQIVIGEWGVLEIVANPFGTGFGAGNVVIRALQSVDLVVRYPQAFGINGTAS